MQAVLLTDAELDHWLGLLLLREAESLELHATATVRETLRDDNAVLATLQACCPVKWREVVLGEDVSLGNGSAYRAFDAPTTNRARFGPAGSPGRGVDYRFTDERSGRWSRACPARRRSPARYSRSCTTAPARETQGLRAPEQHQPVLLQDSPERREVERRGFEVATHGMEVRIRT